MKLTSVHNVTQFKQSAWSKEYIDMNIMYSQQATNKQKERKIGVNLSNNREMSKV